MVDGFTHDELVHPADHFIEVAETEFGHEFAHLGGDEAHEVDHVVGIAGEFFAQLGVLGGHSDRAGVEVAGAHHNATHDDQRRRGEAEFLGAEERADDHITAGFELPVDLDDNTAAEIVEQEGLVRLGQAEFPRHAGMLHAGKRRRAGAAVVSADQDDIGMGLGHPGRNGADPDFADQLDRDAGVAVGILQVVNQFGQILDRINVVVRRRRDESDARSGVAHFGDPRINLGARELAAFAGLRALHDFDLQFLGLREVVAGHAETAGGDLLDRAVFRVAIGQHFEAVGVFAPLTRVALAADAVHGDGQRLVGFRTDRTVGHGTSLEALHDRFDRFDFLDRDPAIFRKFEVDESAQGGKLLRLVVDRIGVFTEGAEVTRAASMLQEVNGRRVERMVLAIVPPLVNSARVEHFVAIVAAGIGPAVALFHLAGNAGQVDAFDAGGGRFEIGVNHLAVQTDSFENLRAAVALDGGNAHLGHCFDDAFDRGLDVLLDRFRHVDPGEVLPADDVFDRFEDKIRVDRARAVTGEQGEVVHFPGLAGLKDEADLRARAVGHEVMVQAGHGEERGDGRFFLGHPAVGENENVDPFGDRAVGGLEEFGQRLFESGSAAGHLIVDGQGGGLETGAVEDAEFFQFLVRDDRRGQLDLAAALRRGLEEIAFRTERGERRGDDFLADRIDRRIGDLREELLEIVVEQLGFVGEGGQRRVVAHRTNRLDGGPRHRGNDQIEVFLRVAESKLPRGHGLVVRVRRLGASRQIFQFDQVVFQPFAIGMLFSQGGFDFLVRNDAPFLRIDEEDAAGLEAAFMRDALGLDVEDADLGGHDNEVVLGHVITAGTKAVAVKDRANLRAVGESNRGRTIPRLHET